jgi:trimeric autotransporter adhesin
VTDVNMCSITGSAIAKVNQGPAITIINDTICKGDTATISANGGITYNWGAQGTNATFKTSPSITTIYSLTATGGNPCPTVTTAKVTVNALPVISTFGDSICAGDTAFIYASGGVIYNCGTAGNTAFIRPTPIVNTVYTVSVTDTNSCTSSSNTTVIINPTPNVITYNDTICNGEIAMLWASGGQFYVWDIGTNNDSVFIVTNVTITHKVWVTNLYDCTKMGSATVFVIPKPTFILLNDTICIGEVASVKLSGGVTYKWSTGATTSTINPSPTTTTQYSVTVTDANMCSDSSKGFVKVIPKTTITLSAPKSSFLTSDPVVTVTPSVTGGIFIGKGMTGSSFAPSTAGIGIHKIFYVKTEPINSCKDSATISFVVGGVGISGISSLEKIEVFPNPTSAQFSLKIASSDIENINVKVYTIAGVLLEYKILSSQNNESFSTFDMSNYASGKYMLVLEKGNERTTVSVVKE